MNFKEALIAHLQGKKVEVKTFKHWEPLTHWASRSGASLLVAIDDSDFATACEFRLAPRTIFVNGVEVPAPESVAPAYGSCYCTPHVTREPGYSRDTWDGSAFDLRVLEHGLVYLNKEDAIARAKAMLIVQESV